MNKQLIYKYLKGEASSSEEEMLMKWISKNTDNEKFFINQMNLWIAQHTPHSKADVSGYNTLMSKIKQSKVSGSDSHLYKKLKILIGSAAAIILFLLSLNVVQYISYDKKYTKFGDYEESFKSNPICSNTDIYTVKGTKARIVLPDSSVVWLNSDSHITYPSKFSGKTRDIKFTGEAYFEVVNDPMHPMLIRDDKGHEVRVLGTRFNLKCYNNDNDIQISLYEGKVQLFEVQGEHYTLVADMNPNNVLVVDDDKQISKSQLILPSENSEWKDGELVFEETPLRDVIKILERWHGVKINVTDDKILNNKFTAKFKSESIIQILEYIKMTSFIDYSVDNNIITLKSR